MKFSFTPLTVKETKEEYKQFTVKNMQTVFKICEDMVNVGQEMMVVLDLNAKLKVIDRRLIALGTLTESTFGAREVFRGAIWNNAVSIIVVHNHPSGEPDPSPADKAATERLVKAGDVIGIPVLDHVIVARRGYYSFMEAGEIDQ